MSYSSIITAQGQLSKPSMIVPYTRLGAYSTKQADVFSFLSNQASLAQAKQPATGIYSERRFLLQELSNYTGCLALPTRSGNFGLKANYNGFNSYKETQLGLAYARSLGSKIDIGAQFNYNGITIPGYGNAAAISFETGLILHLSDKLHTGLHINNPVGGRFGETRDEKLPSIYSVGYGYDVSPAFFFGIEIIKEEDKPVNIDAGFQYKIIPQLAARVGISSATSSWYTGLGLLWKSFRFDIASSVHPQLGITPGALLLFNFNKNENHVK